MKAIKPWKSHIGDIGKAIQRYAHINGSVSYTHLDVYKRQPVVLNVFVFCNFYGFVWIAEII